MRIASRLFLLTVALFPGAATRAQSDGRHISGQVRLGAQTAPAGVPVTLQIVDGKYVPSSTEPEAAHAITDAKGRFVFDHLEKVGRKEGREFFAIAAKVPGYSSGFQVVDLMLVSSAEVTLDLHKETANKADAGSATFPPGSVPRRSANAEAQQHLDRAQEILFHEHDPEGAIAELKQANKADPWYGPSYILLGLANMQLERWSDAQLAFSEASKVEPGNGQAYLGIGSALNEQHDYTGAQKALEQSLKLNPDSAEAQYELARTFSSLEKWDAAEPHARRAIELNSDYSGPHILLANIYLEQQNLSAARQEFQEYLRLDPEGSLAGPARQTMVEIDRALAASKAPR